MAEQAQQQIEDERWMRVALAQAELGGSAREVPVGAVVVRDGEQLGAGYNAPISSDDPSAHAEVVALRDACARVGNYRLPDSTLYVTLEPCMMCAGALVHARVKRLVFGAIEPKAGGVQTHALLQQDWLNHVVQITGGVLADECGALLSDFFAARRNG